MSLGETSTNMTSVAPASEENVELQGAKNFLNNKIIVPEQISERKTEVNQQSPVQDKSLIQIFIESGRKARNFCSEMQYMKAEIIMFVYMFSFVLRNVTAMQLLMNKACLVHMERPEFECNNLTAFKDLKTAVEKMANNYHIGYSLLQMAPSAFLSLFIGSWSDKFGRKAPMIAALIGISLEGVGTTLCAYYMRSRIEFYFIPAVFTGLSGGFIGALLVLYSYVSDVSSARGRAGRYALMEFAFGVSKPLGVLTGGYIFKYYGFVPVFLTSTCCHVFGLFWVIFVLDETRGLDNKDSWQVKFRSFWSFDSVVSSYKATAKWRPNRGRTQIWALIAAMSISIFSLASTSGIGYLYVHHLYDWDNATYSTVSAIFAVLTITVMLIIVPLSKKLKIADASLGVIGSLSMMFKMIITGLSYRPSIFYIAEIVGLLSSLQSLAGRIRISIVASKEDLGKVFAFLTTAESIIPIIAGAIFSQVFNVSLDFFPGLLYVIMGAVLLLPVGIFIWLARLPNVLDYEKMDSNQAENNAKEMAENH